MHCELFLLYITSFLCMREVQLQNRAALSIALWKYLPFFYLLPQSNTVNKLIAEYMGVSCGLLLKCFPWRSDIKHARNKREFEPCFGTGQSSSLGHGFLLMWLWAQNSPLRSSEAWGKDIYRVCALHTPKMKAHFSHRGVSAWINCKLNNCHYSLHLTKTWLYLKGSEQGSFYNFHILIR